MAMLERCPNEILQAIASHMSLSDVLNLRLVCSSTEAGIRSYITITYFHALRVRFSEGGLHYLARKTRCHCLIKGMRLMTIRFYQIPLYHLDHMDSSRLKRLHRDFIASSWHDSEPQAANIMRKLNQWSLYRSFYKAQRRMFEQDRDLRLLQEVMTNLRTCGVMLNIEYEATNDIDQSSYVESIPDLLELMHASNVPKVSQFARLCHMVADTDMTSDMLSINRVDGMLLRVDQPSLVCG